MELFQKRSWAAPIIIGIVVIATLEAIKDYFGHSVAWGVGAVVLVAVAALWFLGPGARKR